MFGLKKSDNQLDNAGRTAGFEYLDSKHIYMDAACQSLRPQPVIDALTDYYTTYNACGGRVKYAWGQKVDETVEATRRLVLRSLGLSAKNYITAFTLNTTYGLNLLLQQLPTGRYKSIITSDIEHNSVFLSTMAAAQRLGIERLVLDRRDDGSLIYEPSQLTDALVVVNVVSNIDGRELANLCELVKDVHKAGGSIILDAAQAVAHHELLMLKCDVDAICFSAHKTYAASLGVIVAQKTFVDSLRVNFVGGGMVSSVTEQGYELTPDDLSSRLEPGLQAYGEIISLSSALQWLETVKPQGMDRHEYIDKLSQQLFDGLCDVPGLTLINQNATPVASFYSESMDAHRLATFLSSAGIMARSGYFCCHYYLHELHKLPPLLRLSIGLHTTEADVERTLATIQNLVGKRA